MCETTPAVWLGAYHAFDVSSFAAAWQPLRQVLRRFAGAGGGRVDSSRIFGNAESIVGALAAELGVP
jgi:hypothetical protein